MAIIGGCLPAHLSQFARSEEESDEPRVGTDLMSLPKPNQIQSKRYSVLNRLWPIGAEIAVKNFKVVLFKGTRADRTVKLRCVTQRYTVSMVRQCGVVIACVTMLDKLLLLLKETSR